MTIGNTFENELATMIFNASSIVNICAATSSQTVGTALTNLAVSLHTGDPGEGGTMATNETSYGAYTRVNVARTATGWAVTNNSVSPSTNITFAACTSGSATITHAAIGVSTTGTAKILFSGTVTPNISVSAGVTPRLTTASTIVLC